MFALTEDQIMNLCNGSYVYYKGKQYYEHSRVKTLEFDSKINGFLALVTGRENYRVKTYFDEVGDFEDASCTCLAYKSYMGYCKHIVAVLLTIKDDKQSTARILENRRKEGIRNIINYFSYDGVQPKVPLSLEINYEFNNSGNHMTDYSSLLHFKIGEQKLYVMKSPKTFIHHLNKNEPLEYGKAFTFLPYKHSFNAQDQPIIDMIKEKVEEEKITNISSWGYNKNSIFNGKHMILSPTSVKRFFHMMGNRKFNACIDGVIYKDIGILEEDLPLAFKLNKDKNNMFLEILGNAKIQALTEDGSYYFYEDNIYCISPEQQKYFTPIYTSLVQEEKNILHIPQDYKENFVSQVLPFVEKIGSLGIDKKIETSIYKPEFRAEIYLDKKDKMVTVEVKYIYGDITINPFEEYHKSAEEQRILVRNIEKEGQIISLLEEAEFKVSSEYIYLEGDEKIYEFIQKDIPALHQLSEVYYSDAFKSIKMYNQSSLSARMRLNEDTNILEFSFAIDGIDKSEIADVFMALQEKKKYYRLKKGGFLPLNLEGLEEFTKMIDYLSISLEDLDQDIIQLPKYRALYLDEMMKETKVKNVQRNIAFKSLIQNIKEPADLDYQVPASFENILRPYQITGFKWLKTLAEYKMGGILADDMGLGKTIQILALLLSEKEEKGRKPSLVVAPTSLVYNWMAEVEKFAPQLKTLVIAGNKEERQQNIDALSEYDLIVTSYPLIRRDIECYQGKKFRCCILDEAQHIKNPSSQNATSVKEITAENYFSLTGTPIENSLTELWSIFDFIMPGYLLTHGRFVKKYERSIIKEENKEALKQLKKQIAPFILRRMKKEVLMELPDKIENKLMVELTKEQKLIYLSYLSQIKGEINDEIKEKGFGRSHIKILAALTRLRQICCHPALFLENYEGGSGKMDLLREVVEESLQGGHRVLLFSQFTSMLTIIRKFLEEQKIEYFYLDGSTDTEKRGTMVERFNQGEREVFLISLKAGGTGLNLTGADTVIHFDPWWNPAVEDQATDRAYRMGQKNTVHVIKLFTKGTIEEKIFAIQEKKKKMIDSVVEPGETIISKLSEDEIRNLFE
ncbi:DEAD/DEAH box helicase [Irregularibacter muris]|uniref:DEAD/DEAH box helicase n=1 Tax=Irregularibacter muris TaxID=1796619 RepID=A0AAE3HFL2_9FIRM|nr:DEAD/DEAH box helicase [Irregularibacter muris]MCR1898554.1 DEAD/DEAH box helicase [Irregularibacter muris]